jgi:hypothetical protein
MNFLLEETFFQFLGLDPPIGMRLYYSVMKSSTKRNLLINLLISKMRFYRIEIGRLPYIL